MVRKQLQGMGLGGRVLGATAVIAASLLGPPVASTQAAAPPVTRLAGADRYATAAAVSAATFDPRVPVAFVARGDTYADALAGGPAAVVDGGPMLLVGSTIPPAIATELTRLRPARIVVLGGPLAVSDGLVTALHAYTTGSVSRLAGADRYATAAAISAATFSPGVGAAYIATGSGFADALAGAAAAGRGHDPILLVPPGTVPASVSEELGRLRPQSVIILGGPAAVSDAAAASLAADTGGGVTRLAGPDRYATAVAVSSASYPGAAGRAYLASGLGFPDALAGGVAAALAPGPLLLVPGSCVPAGVAAEIGRLDPAGLVVLGGDAAVAPAVESLTPCGPTAAACVFSDGATPAFCDTFDSPTSNPPGARSGDLDSTIWGVSRGNGGQNFGSRADVWGVPVENPCNEASGAPDHDVQICNGQLHDSIDDGGAVVSLAMYPKQPFDFAGRTGAITFDVSDNSQGSHAAWPEIWVSDQPVPDPFTHLGQNDYPRNAFGVRFAGCTDSTGAGVRCPGGSPAVGVDSAVVVNNYAVNDSFYGGSLRVNGDGSVTESGPGQVNHFEVDVSENQIDVYGTNAFAPNTTVPPLQHLATIPNAGISFTRGLVWLEDVHYNADKFNTQANNTFNWANFGFDGPVLPRDLTFDAPDSLQPTSAPLENGTTGIQLGYEVNNGSSTSLQTVPMTSADISAASQAGVLAYLWMESTPSTISWAVNGNQLSEPWPFPTTGQSGYTVLLPVPLADLVSGANTVTFNGNGETMNVANVDLWLAGAGGLPR
jgi:putative cell wall-binding protein